jgi:hypothetical protein
VAVDQWTEERRDQSGDADLSGPDEGEGAARNSELLGDRFEKNAQRARKRECSGDVDEDCDADDVPTVKNR